MPNYTIVKVTCIYIAMATEIYSTSNIFFILGDMFSFGIFFSVCRLRYFKEVVIYVMWIVVV